MRDYIEAKDGMILTNGEAYGKQIDPADGLDPNSFYEIPIEEYEELMKSPEATESDYMSALREMGVGV